MGTENSINTDGTSACLFPEYEVFQSNEEPSKAFVFFSPEVLVNSAEMSIEIITLPQ